MGVLHATHCRTVAASVLLLCAVLLGVPVLLLLLRIRILPIRLLLLLPSIRLMLLLAVVLLGVVVLLLLAVRLLLLLATVLVVIVLRRLLIPAAGSTVSIAVCRLLLLLRLGLLPVLMCSGLGGLLLLLLSRHITAVIAHSRCRSGRCRSPSNRWCVVVERSLLRRWLLLQLLLPLVLACAGSLLCCCSRHCGRLLLLMWLRVSPATCVWRSMSWCCCCSSGWLDARIVWRLCRHSSPAHITAADCVRRIPSSVAARCCLCNRAHSTCT